MDNVNIKINGIPYSVPKNSTILEAAKIAGVKIPTLCYLKGINEIGACRICVVEVKGARSLGRILRISCKRGYGDYHKFGKGAQFKKIDIRVDSVNSQPQMSFMCQKR